MAGMRSQQPILLVEDNPDDVAITLRAFRDAGIPNEVLVARDGTEAMEYLIDGPSRGAAASPALVLLDLHMPGADGHEILRRIRADRRTRTIPVVVLTSSTDSGDRSSAYGNGANSYIQKPVDFERMIELARALASYWLVLNQPHEMRKDG
jgi:two-component system response regulator